MFIVLYQQLLDGFSWRRAWASLWASNWVIPTWDTWPIHASPKFILARICILFWMFLFEVCVQSCHMVVLQPDLFLLCLLNVCIQTPALPDCLSLSSANSLVFLVITSLFFDSRFCLSPVCLSIIPWIFNHFWLTAFVCGLASARLFCCTWVRLYQPLQFFLKP